MCARVGKVVQHLVPDCARNCLLADDAPAMREMRDASRPSIRHVPNQTSRHEGKCRIAILLRGVHDTGPRRATQPGPAVSSSRAHTEGILRLTYKRWGRGCVCVRDAAGDRNGRVET